MVAFSTLNGHLLQKTITMHSPHFLYPNSSTNNNNNSILLSLTILSPPSRNPIITCARTTTNKGFFRSKQSRQTLLQLLRFTASHLPYMLPDPLNSLIREFGLGSGSGSGSGSGGGNWKGFGWGGFDGGGRKRRINKKSQFWLLGFVLVCCLGFWWLDLNGRIELKNDVVLGAICLSMFLVLVKNGCVPDWVLGFCGGGVVVGVLGDKRGELKKVVKGLVEMMMGGSRRQRRRRRRGV